MEGVAGQEVVHIQTPVGSMAVELRGPRNAGPAVVFLHGLTASRATWQAVSALLQTRHRLVLVDLLSRGASAPAPLARYDLESEAERVELVLDSLGVRRPVIAGHSHGAAIAVALAARRGAAGLLLANPVTPRLRRPALLRLVRVPGMARTLPGLFRLFRRPLTRYILVRRVFADSSSIPPDLVMRYSEPWRDPGRARCLPRILIDWDPAELGRYGGVPLERVRVLTGDRDRRVRAEDAGWWAERLGGSFEALAGCGHAAPEERPLEVARALEEIIAASGPNNRKR